MKITAFLVTAIWLHERDNCSQHIIQAFADRLKNFLPFLLSEELPYFKTFSMLIKVLCSITFSMFYYIYYIFLKLFKAVLKETDIMYIFIHNKKQILDIINMYQKIVY